VKEKSNLKKLYYFVTGQLRLRKLEARINRVEHDHFALVKRLELTISLYEQRIDNLVNSVAQALPEHQKEKDHSEQPEEPLPKTGTYK
jgi:hypothetical protein